MIRSFFLWAFLFAGAWGLCAEIEDGLHELKVKDSVLKVEVAQTPEQLSRGLMFRDLLPEDRGMLFIFDSPRQLSFWMKNTRIPLSIAYIDPQGKILEIRSMKPFDTTSIISQSDQALYALEVNLGWFDRHGVVAGDEVENLPR